MTSRFRAYMASTALVGGLAAAMTGLAFAQTPGDVTLGERVHPESVAATPDGGLIIGSVAQPIVFRSAPGASEATPWITGGFVEGGLILGVFATDDTAYVCANGPFGSGVGNLLTFDLDTAEPTGTYAFPDGGLCNDIAAAADGTIYVTDTSAVGRVLSLAPGASELSVVVASDAIAGIDGIAFIGDTLYANDVQTGAMYRIDLADDGTGTVATLTTSRPLEGPDGMRTTVDGTALIVAENAAGRIAMLEIDGDNVTVTDIADGYDTPTGVAPVGDVVYVVEAKFGSLFDQTQPDPGVFVAHAVALAEEAAAAPATPAPAPAAPDPAVLMAALMSEGQLNYTRNCQGCHGDQGQGGAGEPLVHSPVVQRAGGTINQILQGSPAHGMPPFDRLSDREVAGIATFIRNSWGNDYGIVTEANVAQSRPR